MSSVEFPYSLGTSGFYVHHGDTVRIMDPLQPVPWSNLFSLSTCRTYILVYSGVPLSVRVTSSFPRPSPNPDCRRHPRVSNVPLRRHFLSHPKHSSVFRGHSLRLPRSVSVSTVVILHDTTFSLDTTLLSFQRSSSSNRCGKEQ